MSSYPAPSEPVYTIGVAAKMLGISVPTVRMYEREGLILSYKSPTGHRYYSQTDMDRLVCIRKMITQEKVSINGIRHLMSLIPCWEITKCQELERNKCQAYLNSTEPCWMIKDKQGICKIDDCRKCPVYNEIATCGDFKKMIWHSKEN